MCSCAYFQSYNINMQCVFNVKIYIYKHPLNRELYLVYKINISSKKYDNLF